jgi:hypothetical protein
MPNLTKRFLGMTLTAASVLAAALVVPTRAAGQTAAAPALPAQTKTALFNMYCYWTGEATLDRVPGVVKTRIGELSGEVVEVEYDPAKTDVGKLAGALKKQGGFYAFLADNPIAKAEGKRYLPESEIKDIERRPRFIESKYNLHTSHPDLAALDLTEQQAMALNSWSYFGGPMPDVLTPEQKEKLGKIRERLASKNR